jgi:hypothetical protein
MGGNAKAASATRFMIGLGNCGNLVSSNVFITDQSPRYKTGFGTGLGLTVLGLVVSTVLEGYYWFKNRRKDDGKEDAKLDDSSQVLGDLGMSTRSLDIFCNCWTSDRTGLRNC